MSISSKVIFALGSNTDRVRNINKAKEIVNELFENVIYSRQMLTIPIGIHSEDFLNCIGLAYTTQEYSDIRLALKDIEQLCGDEKSKRAYGTVNLDIDILQFGEKRMHETDWERPYITELMKDIEVYIK